MCMMSHDVSKCLLQGEQGRSVSTLLCRFQHLCFHLATALKTKKLGNYQNSV